jgi:hypothetical protein
LVKTIHADFNSCDYAIPCSRFFSKEVRVMGYSRMIQPSSRTIYAMLGLGLVMPTPAHALISVFGTPSVGVVVGPVVAGTAIAGATAVSVAGGPKVAGAVAGTAIAAIVIFDPTADTFYNGSFETFFPSDLLTPIASGWLGDWGANPALPAPPVGAETLPAFSIQAPNAALTSVITNDPVAGTQSVTFDWGPSGHAESSSGEFNFFAVAFQATQNVLITDLGAGPGPLPGANLYGDAGITCSAAGSAVVNDGCGAPAANNHSFSVQALALPEPATWLTFLMGFGLLGGMIRRRRVASVPAGATA